MKPTVLVVCGDAGGAAAVAPVVEQLMHDGRVHVHSAIYGQAEAVWRRRGLAFQSLAENLADGHLKDMADQVDLLLLGTSVNGVDYERRLMALVPDRAIAVLDFWSNYSVRFRAPGGTLAQPSRICVMDERAREDMISGGFVPDRIAVTGQPALDDLAGWRARWSQDDERRVRTAFGVRDGERVVLFASQPLDDFYASDALAASRPDYDQHTVLRLLVATLETLAGRHRYPVLLVIRPHPREDMSLLKAYEREGDGLRVVVSTAEDARSAVLAADLVCGMTTMLLMESCLLGQITVSLQPGLKGQDMLPSNRHGWSRLVTRPEEIPTVVESALFDESARSDIRRRMAAICPDGHAAKRVASEVYVLVKGRF